jgi:hypothetical protein
VPLAHPPRPTPRGVSGGLRLRAAGVGGYCADKRLKEERMVPASPNETRADDEFDLDVRLSPVIPQVAAGAVAKRPPDETVPSCLPPPDGTCAVGAPL